MIRSWLLALTVCALCHAGLAGCGARAKPTGEVAPLHRNEWTVQGDSATSAIREVTLAAAHDLSGFLRLLRPLPRPITLRLRRCGQPAEAAWFKEAGEILLCDEIIEYAVQFGDSFRRVARYILAHELGHAVGDLFSEPAIGGSELEADEFAAVFLIETGSFRQDVVEAAQLFQRMADVPDLLERVRAERRARAEAFRCFADGAAKRGDGSCSRTYEAARARWQRRVLVRAD